jgi:hypothetical protein
MRDSPGETKKSPGANGGDSRQDEKGLLVLTLHGDPLIEVK